VSDDDKPYYGRARIVTAVGAVVVASALALAGRDATVVGLFLGFALTVLGVAEVRRRLQ